MKKLMLGLAAGLTAVTLLPTPAQAAMAARPLDQYGCRWESSTQDYRCYTGMFAGASYRSQQDMLQNARVVPVYIDDAGSPRSMPPFAARGISERPPTDAGEMDDVITIF